MEVRNSEAESHSSDQSQPIQETEGDDGSKVVAGGLVDVDEGGGVEVELGNGGGGTELVKKKRGRPPRAQAKSPPIKIIKEEDEDVCFICFDGGSLVLCDRRFVLICFLIPNCCWILTIDLCLFGFQSKFVRMLHFN